MKNISNIQTNFYDERKMIILLLLQYIYIYNFSFMIKKQTKESLNKRNES